ncbi:protein of unknown function [Streptomyces sp. KY75]|nr:protein of unknown function [Streptomyces sp. KY75]CAD5989849.1 protein of unknown function [Streptomyces sp. KY70]
MFTASSLCNCLPGAAEAVRAGLFKGTTNLPKQAGVSTYLALTFGTLLSSQGTDASFGPVSSGPSGRFPSCFFVLLSCVSDSIRLFRVRFPVEAGQAVFLLFASR